MAAFNEALNQCSNVSPEEVEFQFEEHLWKEIALQVYNAIVQCLLNLKLLSSVQI